MRIAGGMFGLESDSVATQTVAPPFMRGSSLLFLSARCCFKFLIDNLKPTQIWMPSYLCCSMLDAIASVEHSLRFFDIDYDLQIRSLNWLDQILPGDLVALIDYFGFPCDTSVVAEVQTRGALVIEDASQALLSSHVGGQADFVVYSPRKIVGVPDGGILNCKLENEFPPAIFSPPPERWWLCALEAVIGRREFDRYGGERSWFDLFRHVEANYPLGPFRMSELTEMLLKHAFDYSRIANVRRMNYNVLLGLFPDLALLGNLDDLSVPLGFPIRVKNRDRVRGFLFDHNIFPPVHWQICDCVPSRFVDSYRLSSDIMTIPCDHRLSTEDMLYISDVLRRALENC